MPSIFSKGKSRSGNINTTASRKLTAKKDAAKRRKIISGYPVMNKFEDKEDLNRYLSGDKIECLICGKLYHVLNVHLMRIHDYNPDTYKEFYNIPYSYPLVGRLSSKKRAAAYKIQIERTGSPLGNLTYEDRLEIAKKSNSKKQRISYMRRKYNAKGLKNKAGDWIQEVGDDVVLMVFDKMVRDDINLKDACKEIGKCGYSTARRYIDNDSIIGIAYKDAISKLSFKTQSECSGLGKKFKDKVKELRGMGYSYEKISNELRVSCNTVHKYGQIDNEH